MKYPLLMHRDQETYEDDDKRLGFIDVGKGYIKGRQ